MIDLWIPVTLFAAFCQNARSAVQRHLKGVLSTTGATFSRFGYAFPLAIAYCLALHHFGGWAFPEPKAEFWIYASIGGAAQIGATQTLLYLFSFRNFAVGTTYSKTETVQAAIFGIVILGDPLAVGALLGILISLAGVVAISVARQSSGIKGVLLSWTERTALIGLASGALFGISAVSYRAASLSLEGPGFLMQAAFTLACVTVMQTIAMAIYMQWKEPGQLWEVIKAWRMAGLAGVFGMAASAGWFTAMTIQNAAYVRALGQIELVFTFAASYFIFKEQTNRTEAVGIGLIIAGIVVLLLMT